MTHQRWNYCYSLMMFVKIKSEQGALRLRSFRATLSLVEKNGVLGVFG